MYESHLRLYLLPHLDRVPLAALTTGDLQAMFAAISRQHEALNTPLSATTLHGIRCTVRAALNGAIREGLLTDNPARWVELPNHPRPHPVVWTPSRIAPGPQAAHGPRSRCGPLLTLLASCPRSKPTNCTRCCYSSPCAGLRRSEAAGLCWEDVDLDEACLTINHTLHEHYGGTVLLPPKTVASARTIALDRITLAA